jgi:hypothetical protein
MIGQAQRFVWPAGEHDFCLRIGELRALEQRCDAGIAQILLRLMGSTFKVDDVFEVLRLGLQGGGMSERQAIKTIDLAFPHANLFGLAPTAAKVLLAFTSWPIGQGEDEPDEGELKAAGEVPNPSRSEEGAPAGQTPSEPLQ